MRASALVAVAALVALGQAGLGAPPTHAITLEVVPMACGAQTCLGYNGQIPGPTIDVRVGDVLVVTLVNRYSEPVSWHVHGTALAADMDGVAAHPGTNLVASVAPPGGSFTYTTRAAFAGSWHYHDHVLGPDGSEGVARGLFGGLVVRNGGEPRPDHTFDLHMLDAGANGGRGFAHTASVGDSFEILVAGLENTIWPLQLRSPTGAILDRATVGPGMSDRLSVASAVAGTYTVRAGSTVGAVVVS